MQSFSPMVAWHAHSETCLLVHMVWGTKERLRWLEPRLDDWLTRLLERKAKALDAQLLAAGFSMDHAHVLVRHPPRISVSQIAHRLKGASSRGLHLALPHLRGHDWQSGYWAQSVSPNDLPSLTEYVRSQRLHHPTPNEKSPPF